MLLVILSNTSVWKTWKFTCGLQVTSRARRPTAGTWLWSTADLVEPEWLGGRALLQEDLSCEAVRLEFCLRPTWFPRRHQGVRFLLFNTLPVMRLFKRVKTTRPGKATCGMVLALDQFFAH